MRTFVVIGEGAGEDPRLWDWSANAPERRPDLPFDLDDTVVIAPTGCATGVPKGVMDTHRSLAVTVAHQLMAFPYEPGEPIVNLATAPMTDTAGLLALQTRVVGRRQRSPLPGQRAVQVRDRHRAPCRRRHHARSATHALTGAVITRALPRHIRSEERESK